MKNKAENLPIAYHKSEMRNGLPNWATEHRLALVDEARRKRITGMMALGLTLPQDRRD